MSFSWLTDLDRLVFGRYHVEVSGSLSAQESLNRLQSCVKPFVSPMFFPREALYGTVTNQKMSFSRIGGDNQFGPLYEFVGALVSTSSGTSLVGDVRAKWYVRAVAIFFPCFFIFGFLTLTLTAKQDTMPVFPLVIFPIWMLLVFSLLTVHMRRSAEGMANYIGLVVATAFSSSPTPFLVR